MAFQRDSSNDWVTFDESDFIDPSKALKLHPNGRLYVPSNSSSSFLFYPTTIKGYNSTNGVVEQTIIIEVGE